MNPLDRATKGALQLAQGYPGSAVASAIRELERQYRIMREASRTQNASLAAAEQIARVSAATEGYRRSQEHLAGMDVARQELRHAAERREALLGPAAALEDIRHGFEFWRSTRAERQAQGRDESTAAFLRSQEQLREALRTADTQTLVTQLGAAMREAARGRVALLSSSPGWQQVIDAMSVATRPEPAQRLAQELAAAHPGTSQAEASAAVLEAVVEHTVGEESDLGLDEADRIVSFGLEAMGTMEKEVLAAAETQDQALFGLLQLLVEELERRGVKLRPAVLRLLVFLVVTVLPWQCASEYTKSRDRQNDRVQGERHDSMMKAITQLAPDRLQYRAIRRVVVREQPSGKAPVLARLEAGRQVIQREREGKWLHVDVVDRHSDEPATGWVFRGNLRLLPSSRPPLPGTTK